MTESEEKENILLLGKGKREIKSLNESNNEINTKRE